MEMEMERGEGRAMEDEYIWGFRRGWMSIEMR